MTPVPHDETRLTARWREQVREDFAAAATARLSPDGDRVLCGKRDAAGRYACGQPLMHFFVDADTGEASWWLSSGWVRGDRRGAEFVWRLSEHAKAKLRRGHAIA
jgi:hypothetical protein